MGSAMGQQMASCHGEQKGWQLQNFESQDEDFRLACAQDSFFEGDEFTQHLWGVECDDSSELPHELDSLTYTPIHWDESPTFDAERFKAAAPPAARSTVWPQNISDKPPRGGNRDRHSRPLCRQPDPGAPPMPEPSRLQKIEEFINPEKFEMFREGRGDRVAPACSRDAVAERGDPDREGSGGLGTSLAPDDSQFAIL